MLGRAGRTILQVIASQSRTLLSVLVVKGKARPVDSVFAGFIHRAPAHWIYSSQRTEFDNE
jgi:hypothetical protein